MNTLHFKYAVEVERSGSITQAADNLYMAQPNLSKAIKELEDNLGISIFKRTSKGVAPTQKGAEFLVYAKNILSEIDNMKALLTADNSNMQSLSISIPHGSYITHGLTKFLAQLSMGKEIDINIKETNALQTIDNIVERQFNLGVIRYETKYETYFLDYLAEKSIAYDLIWEFEYLAIMSKNHPLASAKEIKMNQLKEYIEIIQDDITIPYIPSDELKKSKEATHGNKRIYVHECYSQFDFLSHIPTTYMWVSPISDELLKRYELVQRKCHVPNHQYKDLLIYPKGYKFTALDKKLINKLYESKNEVAFNEYQ